MNQCTKTIKKSKEVKSDNFCYREVGRAINQWGAIEESPILLSKFGKTFDRAPKIISYFERKSIMFPRQNLN